MTDFPGGSEGKESACNAGDPSSIFLCWEDTLEKGMQPNPVFLPGKFNRQEKLGGLQSLASQRVRHD